MLIICCRFMHLAVMLLVLQIDLSVMEMQAVIIDAVAAPLLA